jgi:hypothetical protein
MAKMKFDNAEAWYAACAAMVREGMTFHAYAEGNGWVLEFTGGY